MTEQNQPTPDSIVDAINKAQGATPPIHDKSLKDAPPAPVVTKEEIKEPAPVVEKIIEEIKLQPQDKQTVKAEEPKKEIVKEEPKQDVKSPEIDYDAIINAELEGTKEEPKDIKKEEVAEKSSFTLQELAEKLKLSDNISSVEDLERAISRKTIDETRWQEPIRERISVLSDAQKLDDETLLTKIRQGQNWTEDEIKNDLSTMTESEKKREAIAARVAIRNDVSQLNQQLTEGEKDRTEKNQKQVEQFTKEMRNTIASVKEINGVTLSGEQIKANQDFVLNRQFDRVLQDPKQFAEVAALYNNRDAIIRNASEKAARTAVRQFKEAYDRKLFNKDLGKIDGSGGKAPQAEKELTATTIVDAIQEQQRKGKK